MSTKKLQIIGNLGGSSVQIDDTLTKPGQAADAKVTGDAINQLQVNIDEVAGLIGGSDVEYYTEEEIDSMVADLNAAIDSKSNFNHVHDDLYYTETEIDDKFDAMQSAIDSKVDAEDGKGLSTNDYTTAEKDKLSTVEDYANFYEHPIHNSHSSGLYKVTIDESGHVSGATLASKEDIVALGIPEQDTTYEEEISDLNDRIDDVENSINTTDEALEGIAQDFESYKTTNNEAVSTNASGIEANKTAIEEIQSDYLTSANQQLLQDGINEVSDKATANAAAIEILNGDGSGSVKQSIDNAFNEFAANVTNDDVVNTYKELIDYAAKHGPEFTELVGVVDDIDVRVGEIEVDLSNYKTAVSDQFAEIDSTISNHISETQEALEEKADLEHEHNDLYYTKDEILESITVEDIDDICEFTSGEGVDLVSAATEEWVRNNYQIKGDYATEIYVNNKIAEITTSDASGQINTHNTSESAHSDIRQLISDTIDDFTIKIEEAGSIDIDLGGSNEGEPNPINADTLGGKPASEYVTNDYVNERVKKAAPRNLLDNSDFRNPVAQAGINGRHGSNKYVLDRWISWNADIVQGDGYITPGSPIDQYFYSAVIDLNKVYTAAIGLADGGVIYYNGKFTDGFGYKASGIYGGLSSSGEMPFVRIATGQNVVWAALYEGEYTAETLPAYQPKGYGVELAECQRYYRRSWVGDMSANGSVAFIRATAGASHPAVSWECPMRAKPNVVVYSWGGGAGCIRDWGANADVSGIETSYVSTHGFSVGPLSTTTTAGKVYCFHYEAIAE